MADPEVKLKFAGNAADAERAIAILERRLGQLENGVKQSSKRMSGSFADSAKAFDAIGQGAQDFLGSLTGMRGPLDVMVKAIQVMKEEWDDLIKRQDAAADSNMDFAKNLQAAANNSDAPLKEIKARMIEISETSLITPQQSAHLLNIGQGAKGQLPDKSIDATIVAAAQLAKIQGTEAMAGLVDTGLMLQKQVPGTTPEQAVGFSLAAQAKSRVPEAKDFNSNVLPGIIGVNKLDGTSLEYAAAMSAGITQAAEDKTGRKSRTAMTALALQLRDAFPELKDTEARVKALQESPELRKAFLQGGEVNGRKLNKMKFDVTGPDGQVLQLDTDRASFERQMVPAIEQMLTKGTQAYDMMQESLRTVPSLQKADVGFRQRAADFAEDPTLMLANKQVEGQVRTEIAKVADLVGSNNSINRELVEKRLAANGFGAWQRSEIMGDAGWSAWAGRDYGSSLIERMEQEKGKIYAQQELSGRDEILQKQYEVLTQIQKELSVRPVVVNRDGGKDDR